MPPKSKDKKGIAQKAKKVILPEIDWCADENFKPQEPLVFIEHDRRCFVYREQEELFEATLTAAFPDRIFHFLVNTLGRVGELGPRDGSFEISFAQNARCVEEVLWSGLKKGPPRRLKFPNDYAAFLPQLKKIMSRYFKMTSAENLSEND